MAGIKTITIFLIMFAVAMITQEDVNHGVCPVPMTKEEEEYVKQRERSRELMEEIAREIEITCLDECETGQHNCHDDAYCTNTKRSFTCTCKPGYSGDGVNCEDIDECKTGTHNCDVTRWCYNTKGSFDCPCREGYSENGENECTDINECETGKHNCGANATCKNTKGSFVCTCKPGYSWNGVSCTDVNECITGVNNCNANADCNNTEGSFECTCKPGYSGNGVYCIDVNECITGEHRCDANADCNNTEGSFECTCKPGYSGNGVNCTDINECEAGKHNCHANANCKNSKGSFVCTCKPGYSGTGFNCRDVNECITGEHSCDANEDCNNTEGSFECTCKPGYSGNGVNCTDVNECATGKHNCNGSFICHNTKGSFLCICREPGYFWNGVNCTAFRLDSNILKTNSSYLYHLGKFLQPAIGYYSRWLLCWRATLHGWNVRQFHRRCDGKRDTVTIIKKGKYVFGGYTDIPWESSGGWGFTRKAFIFSISNKEELDPFVSEVRRPDWAIGRLSWLGPVFGSDIIIVNNANSSSYSQAGLVWYYPAPAAVQDPSTILAGTYRFSPDEVEVFYLDPTQ